MKWYPEGTFYRARCSPFHKRWFTGDGCILMDQLLNDRTPGKLITHSKNHWSETKSNYGICVANFVMFFGSVPSTPCLSPFLCTVYTSNSQKAHSSPLQKNPFGCLSDNLCSGPLQDATLLLPDGVKDPYTISSDHLPHLYSITKVCIYMWMSIWKVSMICVYTFLSNII